MRPCDKCLENNWDFQKLDTGWVRATCHQCGNEVEFEGKKKIENEGDICRKCRTKVILRQTKKTPKQLQKSFYYTAYLFCPKCKTMYMAEKYKVLNYDPL